MKEDQILKDFTCVRKICCKGAFARSVRLYTQGQAVNVFSYNTQIHNI